MNKKRSEAAIASLLDDISSAGISPVEDEVINVDRTPPESTPPQFPNQTDGGKEIVTSIATNRCKPWALSDRSDEEMGNIEELANSIKTAGQQEPALARKLPKKDGQIEFEIIFGHRRWKACQLIGLPLKVIIKNISDQQAAVAQKEENENRKGISDYSRAFNYQKLLSNKLFKSISELAANMNTSKTNIVDLLSYTRINQKVLQAMPQPHKLLKKSAVKLAAISKNINDESLKVLIKLAPDISTGKISAQQIDKKLKEEILGSVSQKKYSATFKTSTGSDLFTSRHDSNGSPIIVFHKLVRDNVTVSDIEKILNDFLISRIEDAS